MFFINHINSLTVLRKMSFFVLGRTKKLGHIYFIKSYPNTNVYFVNIPKSIPIKNRLKKIRLVILIRMKKKKKKDPIFI